MNRAVALANNDTVFLSWLYDRKIDDCLGFAIYRTNNKGKREALPAWVGFKGGSNPDWQHKDTSIWPIQKFSWKDFTATRGATYTYEIVPMVGSKDALKPGGATLKTDPVKLTPKRKSFDVYFTNGILATQALTRIVPKGKNGAPDPNVLRDRIDQPGDPLRMKLAGQILDGLTKLLDRARDEGGNCYCAIYELDDTELVKRLLDAKGYVHILLGNTGTDDKENKPARQTLHEAGVDITDRMVGSGHIAHNKFYVYVDKEGNPAAVLTGSTNWTSTGVCTQSNNSVVIASPELAQAYLDYWNRLKADDSAQGPALRQADRSSHTTAIDGAQTTVWFSPNMTQKSKPSKNPAEPPDLTDVFAAMAAAKHAIIFLVFQPGSPSIVEYAAACENAKPGLLVYGAATDPNANENYETLLIHRTTKDIGVVDDNAAVVSASGVDTEFAYWQKELLKLPEGHAIIHDKIIVIDPMTPDCVVITGSHNQGYRASYNNDENFVIVRGHQELAAAYATHVMDVYDHYRWRFTLKKSGVKNAFQGLDPTPKWQDKYFRPDSTARNEAMFWTGQLPALPNIPAPAVSMKSITAKTGPAKKKATKTTKAKKKTAKTKPLKKITQKRKTKSKR